MTPRKLPRYDKKGSAFTASRNISEISIMTEPCALLKMLRVSIAVLSAAMACYIYQHKRQATLRILVWDDLRDMWGKCQRVNVCSCSQIIQKEKKGPCRHQQINIFPLENSRSEIQALYPQIWHTSVCFVRWAGSSYTAQGNNDNSLSLACMRWRQTTLPASTGSLRTTAPESQRDHHASVGPPP